MIIGRKVEQMLQDPETPNELKLRGFANVLHEEWEKEHPDSNESNRSLNMMYSRLLRMDDPINMTSTALPDAINATWTPKHNGVLKKCMHDVKAGQAEAAEADYTKVIKKWRMKFPKSSVLDDDLIKRIDDLEHGESTKENFDTSPPGPPPAKKAKKAITNENLRQPNSRGQVTWNKVAIRDLLQCHAQGLVEHKGLQLASGSKPVQKLSELVHDKFLRLHPYCRLSPSILMSKCYTLKSQVQNGTIQLEPETLQDQPDQVVKDEIKEETIENPGKVKRSGSRDLVFRTWTQQMIDDMLKTRKNAMLMKKKSKDETFNMSEAWYEEFIKLHPDYKSSKKNLWRKYKWYKSRMADVQSNPEV